MPTVTVTAQKEPEDKQKVPVSVTAVSQDTIENAGIHIVSEAAIYAPNTFFTEWTARKLSNARFRGISSSPNNPGITTYIDGVPQLNANSSSIELLDVDQIEFVRGPQSALFGRNTLGGLVNITSARPSLSKWTGALSVPFGNHGSWAVRGGASGPVVADKLSVGVSFAQVDRDGFTVNDVTGNDIDHRDPRSPARRSCCGCRTAPGRRASSSPASGPATATTRSTTSAALRANPFHAARDFEGRADRDVIGTTDPGRRAADRSSFSSTTGFLNWKTQDVTDLDYTPRPIAHPRQHRRRTSSSRRRSASRRRTARRSRWPTAPRLRWQSGVFLFTQDYEQDAINSYAPFVVRDRFRSASTRRVSALDDFGLGLFGQGTVTFNDRLDLTAGARFDYEDKSATLENFYEPPIAARHVGRRRQELLERLAAGGGRVPAPAGQDALCDRRAGIQSRRVQPGVARGPRGVRRGAHLALRRRREDALGRRPRVGERRRLLHRLGRSAAERPQSGGAGAVLHLQRRRRRQQGRRGGGQRAAAPGVDLFTAVGYTHARFAEGSVSSGVNVEGNKIPNTPDYTASAGAAVLAQRSARRRSTAARMWCSTARSSTTTQNTLGQDAYSLVNLRVGVTGRFLIGELFVRNAFDTRYIPLAFPYPSFAPSGFMGEMGAPRTVGVSIGVRF